MASDIRNDENKKQNGGFQMSAGLMMVGIGVIFLINEITNFQIINWWAIFILVPAVLNWGNAYKLFQETGTITKEVIQMVLTSLFPVIVASIFFFDMDWGKVWPVFIIIGGVTALGIDWGNRLEESDQETYQE